MILARQLTSRYQPTTPTIASISTILTKHLDHATILVGIRHLFSFTASALIPWIMKQPPLLGQLTKMNFWKTEKGDDQDQDAKVQVNIISPDEKNKSPQHYDASTASTDDSQNGNAIVEDSVKTLSKPQHALIPPNIPYPSSPSKRAVHIMNQTSGLCADPIRSI